MNTSIFMGNVANDVAITYSKSNGKDLAIAKFNLAINEGYGEAKKTYFFNLVAFGKNAEFCEKYVRKGGKYLFTCHPTSNVYTDKDGVKHYNVVFVIDHTEFCTPASAGDTKETKEVSAPSPAPAEDRQEQPEEVQQDFYGDLGSDLAIY